MILRNWSMNFWPLSPDQYYEKERGGRWSIISLPRRGDWEGKSIVKAGEQESCLAQGSCKMMTKWIWRLSIISHWIRISLYSQGHLGGKKARGLFSWDQAWTNERRDGSFLILEVQKDQQNLEVGTLVGSWNHSVKVSSSDAGSLNCETHTVEKQPLKRDVYCVHIAGSKELQERRQVREHLVNLLEPGRIYPGPEIWCPMQFH